MKDQYQLALAAGYLRLREEVAQQYREDLNRFAMQTLAASNATTNALLAELVQTIDTTQVQDLRRIALALSQIEAKRVQDRTQLAAGLQTLAYRTEDELSRTKKVLARFMIEEPLPEMNPAQRLPRDAQNERNEE
jgi:1-aminocyclopropane-1-carboxylate deaminase/D-cysteine desulfhydrase-like pyridoxal-dependent ACC family enzyme